ncbi:hypothetical protein [Flavobacterium hungaricum]|nr:hypothetical protein [Flavobacterium hungaricum]
MRRKQNIITILIVGLTAVLALTINSKGYFRGELTDNHEIKNDK